MAKYFALVSSDTPDCILQDLNTGLLKIYETKKQAKAQCKKGQEVVSVKVKRKERYIGLPVSHLDRPDDWWDD